MIFFKNMLFWLLAAIGWGRIASAITGSPDVCGTSAEIGSYVTDDRVAGWGLTAEGKLVTLLRASDGQWAITFSYPNRVGRTCFIATGAKWRPME